MADFTRFLPLSQRSSGPETGVSSDRRAALAELVETATALVREGGDRAAPAEAFVDGAGLRAEYDAELSSTPSETLTRLAERIRSGRHRRVSALVRAARALLLLARELGADVEIDAMTAGAIALHLAGTGPFDRRAIVEGHTVRATDAEWSFGNGPVLEGRASAIAAFLLGTSDDPPHPPVVGSRR